MGATFQKYRTTDVRITVKVVLAAAAVALALGFGAQLLAASDAGAPVELLAFFGFTVLVLSVGAARMILDVMKAVAAARSEVYLFDSGFVHTNGSNRAWAFLWPEMSVARYESPDLDTPHNRYTVKRPDGATVVLDDRTYWNDADVAELGREIDARATAAQIPQVLAAVRSGRTVRFGRLAINGHGLRDGRRDVPWNDIVDVGVSRDKVIVKTVHSFRAKRRHPTEAVPNVSVLEAVARTLIRDSAEEHD